MFNHEEWIISTHKIYTERHAAKTRNIEWGDVHLNRSGDFIRCGGLPTKTVLEFDARNLGLSVSAQRYGPMIEAAIITMCGFVTVSSKLPLGDARGVIGEVEIKVSLPTAGKISVQQVRVDRPIDWYCLFFYDWRTRYLFFGFVPSDVIKTILGSQSHGTKASSAANQDREFCLANLTIKQDGALSANLKLLDRYNYYGGGSDLVD